jgi:hypothetical protein
MRLLERTGSACFTWLRSERHRLYVQKMLVVMMLATDFFVHRKSRQLLVYRWAIADAVGLKSIWFFSLGQILLFVAMPGLAAANRYRITPRLERSIDRGDTGAAVKALRNSLVLETGDALLILLLVAWLGVLSPSAPL